MLAILALIQSGVDPIAGGTGEAISDLEWGKRIYRDGILPSGKPVRATLQGDVVAEGSQFSCASCHRRSGFASGEGALYVPPVTGPSLFRATRLERADLFRQLYQDVQPKPTRARVRAPRVRPAYTDQSLAIAVREGRDPTGRELDPTMPRYLLDDKDAGYLVAYLKTLSATPAPGVDDAAIHFAAVVTEGVAPEARSDMLDVMHAYFRTKNTDTNNRLQRPGHSPWFKDDFYGAYRKWILHVWTLEGPPESWATQLEAYYRARPVFALLSGIGSESWEPVSEFCSRQEVPCLFPNTDLPDLSQEDHWSLHLSRGLAGEAEALARHILDRAESADTTRVVQVYRNQERGRVPALALRRSLESPMVDLQYRVIEAGASLPPAFRKRLFEGGPSTVVLWLDEKDLEDLALASNATEKTPQIYLSYGLLQGIPPSIRQGSLDQLYLTYPFALSEQSIPRIYRVRSWLRARGIAGTHERIQANTYFALSIADHALVHLLENFYRDYFVESIEHETENGLNPGVFPHLSLGPGQRFASKGCYIVKPSGTARGEFEAVTGWIVP